MKESSSNRLGRSWLLVFGISLLVYVLSCAPGAVWQDSGMIQYRVWHNDIKGGLGLALAHPLFYIIAIAVKSVPIGEFGYRINLISAVFGAVTIANVYLLLRISCCGLFSAVVGAVSLGLSWTFWQHCSIAETYTLYTALFSAELVILFKYFKEQKIVFLYLLAFINGLSVSNHMFGVLPLACYLVVLVFLIYRKEIKLRQVCLMGLLWVAGCLPYAVLIIQELTATGDFVGTVRSALFGDAYSSDVLNVGLSGKIVLENFMFFGLSFPTPNALLFFGGLFAAYKKLGSRVFVNVLFALTVIFFAFAFRYTVVDRYSFFIPFYCMAAVFIGVGCQWFVERFDKKFVPCAIVLFLLLPIAVYIVVPVYAERAEISLGTQRQIPYRNEHTYFLRPWQGGHDAPEKFATEALNSVDQGGVIIADGTTVYPLWYEQEVGGLRKDVKVISNHGDYKSPVEFVSPETFDDLLREKSVYVVTPQNGYCPKFILDGYDFVESGPIHKIVRQ